MNCSNCGTYNNPESKFCVKCGTPLNNENISPQVESQQVMTASMSQSANNIAKVTMPTLNYFMYLIAILLRPFQCYKEEEVKLNNNKTTFVLTLIIIVIMTLSKLIQTIFATVRVMNYSFTEGYSYTWNWGNLKNVNWLTIIGKNLIINIGIVLGMALVFYLGSLIIKKQLSFVKSLTISVTSVIPLVLGAMILSPILSLIWKPLGVCSSIIGMVYSFIILYEFMNAELNLERDKKIYFNLICFGILLIIGYYIYMKLFMSSITGGLDDISNLFN